MVRTPAAPLSHGCSQRDIYASLLHVDDDDTDEALVCVATKIVFFSFFFFFSRKCASFSSHTLKTTSKASFPSEGVKLGTHTELFYISFYHLAAVCDITCGKSDWRIKGRSKHTEP